MKTMPNAKAIRLGYHADKRKRRRQHRQMARKLSSYGGSTMWAVAMWHREQARWVGR